MDSASQLTQDEVAVSLDGFSQFALRTAFVPVEREGSCRRSIPQLLFAEVGEAARAWIVAAVLVTLRRYQQDSRITLPLSLSGDAEMHGLSIEVTRATRFSQVLASLEDQLSCLPRVGELGEANFLLCIETALSTDQLPVVLEIELQGAGATLRLSWKNFPLAQRQAEALLQHVESVLSHALQDPQGQALGYPMLSSEEYSRLVVDFNQTTAPYPDQELLHAAFERMAQHQPDAVALSQGAQTISFSELNRRSNRLAHYLRGQGIVPGQFVAICAERGFEMIVAVFAALKAGCVYVPIEPSYPAERVQFMLDDTQAAVVLTTTAAQSVLPPQVPRLIVDHWHQPWEEISPDSDPLWARRASDLAYVIYTSGSTGKPKGVAIEHRTARNLIEWVNQRYAVGPADRVLAVASICFDLSVYDVFGALGAGARLEIARESDLKEPSRLSALLLNQQITFWNSAPAALTQLVPYFAQGSERLRLVFLSGDWIPVPLPQQIRAAFPHAQVVSLGGATEASIWSNFYEITEVDSSWPSIPYGRPTSNARYYVLDDELNPLPVGVPGRLFIGGDCLAREYFNRPELTRERFVPDPFSDGPDARMYDTGDVACHALNGELEFLGRADNQVKIRGYRVELGEVEAALASHPAVKTAVCIARKDAGGFNTLYAYVIAGQDHAGTIQAPELKAHLLERLPHYMVPPFIVELQQLPITANGKLDTKALPVPEALSSTDYDAPVGEIEHAVAQLYEQLLGRSQVGRRLHFFESGGHSLLAVQLVTRLRARLQVDVEAAELFAAPRVCELAQLVEAKLAQKNSGAGGVIASASAQEQSLQELRPEARADAKNAALSSPQERLWFIDRLEENANGYNIAEAFELIGPLDVARLEGSLRAIVERHQVLRTVFFADAGVPRARVAENSFALRVEAASGLSETELVEKMAAEASRPFDLGSGELIRCQLLRITAERSLIVLVAHHIVMDGWSLRNLYSELRALYSGKTLPELPLQYADYALWQRAHSRSTSVVAARARWVEKLRGLVPLELPTDHARPAVQSYEGDVVDFELSKELVARLESVAQEHGATLFMVFFALYQVLLARYSGQRDFAIGIPASTRAHAEFEPLIGFLLNTLPVRVDYQPEASFSSHLRQVRDQTVEVLSWQEVPFEELVQALNLPRDESRPALHQAIFAYQAEAPELSQLAEVRAERRYPGWRSARFDLTLDLQRQADGSVRGFFEYATQLFARDSIARMAGHMQQLLQNVAGASAVELQQTPIGRLNWLSESERNAILYEVNQTQRDFDSNHCVHRLFEENAQNSPERVAVMMHAQQLSYAELNHMAARIAFELSQRGVRAGDAVGLCASRSPNLVAAALGVMKLGAAYVPLDPMFPPDRIAYMLQNSGARVVLTDTENEHLLSSSLHGADSLQKIAISDVVRPGRVLDVTLNDPEALAYIMYTSGSTGQPKGVEISQRNLVNLIYSFREMPGLGRDDCILASTTLSFDISILEIFAPLVLGGSIALSSADEVMGGLKFAEMLARYPITVVQGGPLALRNLLHSGWQGDKKVMLIAGGEAFPADLIEPLCARARRVINGYGPTETTVYSAMQEMLPDGGPVTVGPPIANTQIYVLDEFLQPVPVGVVGEMYISGAGVARGYHARADLTSERFLPNPFVQGARMYKTGDAARLLADGRFEVTGRLDNQVKLNGYRIEAGDVESALLAIDSIKECSVMVREDRPGTKELVAYVIASSAQEAELLRAQLAQKLPRYMVPSRFVQLESFPRLPNGKLNRKALPAPDTTAETSRGRAKARTPVEESLVAAFSEVLGRAQVGIDDSFFELGGSSLQTLQVIDRLHKRGLAVDAGQLFRNPTVRALAAGIGARLAEGTGQGGNLVVMQEFGDKEPLFLVHSMPGDLLGYGELVHEFGAQRPIFGLHGLGKVDNGQSLRDKARVYAGLINRFRPTGVLHLAGWCFGGTIALEMATYLRSWGRRVGMVALVEAEPSISPLQEKLGTLRRIASGQLSNRRKMLHAAMALLQRNDINEEAFALEITEGPFANRGVNYAANRLAADLHRTRYYPGEIVVVRSQSGGTRLAPADDYGWSQYVKSVRVHKVLSSHEDVIRRPHAAQVAQHLAQLMGEYEK